MVQIALHTGTADTIYEMMNQGLVDIGLFMEPVRTEGLEYIRIQDSDQGLGYPVSIEGAPRYWRTDLLIQKPLYPEIKSNTVIAWRRNIPYAQAVECFIDEVNAFQA